MFIAAYATVTLGMYLGQRKLQYVPDTRLVHPAERGVADFRSVFIPTGDGEKLAGWYAAPPRDGAPVIVYFQGNAQAVADRYERFDHFHREGYGVLAINYRGYGGSTGSPSEAGLIADGRAAIGFLKAQGVRQQRMILYGESLGSGVVMQLAAAEATRPAALILEAPYASAADIARGIYWFLPVDLLMKDQFRSIDFAASVDVPVFIHHGDADRVVPIAQGRRLYAALAGPKEFLAVPGGTHVAPLTIEIWLAMETFLDRHGLKASL